jgi:hypothetical protein
MKVRIDPTLQGTSGLQSMVLRVFSIIAIFAIFGIQITSFALIAAAGVAIGMVWWPRTTLRPEHF